MTRPSKPAIVIEELLALPSAEREDYLMKSQPWDIFSNAMFTSDDTRQKVEGGIRWVA